MGSEWLKNLCGASLSDEKMRVIPHPTLELIIHVTTKTTQLGGTLGTLLIGPILAARRGDIRKWPSVSHHMARAGRGGLLLGLVTGPVSAYLKASSEDGDHVYDRCYRLRYNRGQVRMDQASVVFAAGGTGLALATGGSPLFGGLVGMSSGIFLTAFYTYVLARR